jgi:tetratricopeptide (TPR) repeat protein
MSTVVEDSKVNRFCISRFCRYFFWIALASHLAWYLSGLIWPYYWNVLASLLMPIAGCLLTNRSADGVASCLYGGGPEDIAQQNYLRGEMDKVRFFKAKRNFDKALALLNDVLNQDPNFAEALYLKAHVLWEGFKNPWGAECCFRRVLELTEASEQVHCWASSCLSRIHNRASQ